MSKSESLRAAAEIAYSEMAFTMHDILDPRRRANDEAWRERRSESLAMAADRLRMALDSKEQ